MPTTLARRLTRTDVLAGTGFIVAFIGGVVSSSPPDNNASNAKWVANYTGSGNQWTHVLSGVFLIIAAICLMTFLTGMWHRIASVRPAGSTSPLPLVAAGVAAACMAFGGVLMAYISGSELTGKYPLPSADLLRLSNGLGFIVTGIPGMAAVALCITVLAVQARRTAVFGPKMAVFSWIVAAVLLLSFLFLPIVALMVWIVACLVSARRTGSQQPADQPGLPAEAVTALPNRSIQTALPNRNIQQRGKTMQLRIKVAALAMASATAVLALASTPALASSQTQTTTETVSGAVYGKAAIVNNPVVPVVWRGLVSTRGTFAAGGSAPKKGQLHVFSTLAGKFTVRITARPAITQSASLKACRFSFSTRVLFAAVKGTGKFAGVSGTGVVKVSEAGYGSRYTSGSHKGQCNTSPKAPELAKGAVETFQLSADLKR